MTAPRLFAPVTQIWTDAYKAMKIIGPIIGGSNGRILSLQDATENRRKHATGIPRRTNIITQKTPHGKQVDSSTEPCFHVGPVLPNTSADRGRKCNVGQQTARQHRNKTFRHFGSRTGRGRAAATSGCPTRSRSHGKRRRAAVPTWRRVLHFRRQQQ